MSLMECNITGAWWARRGCEKCNINSAILKVQYQSCKKCNNINHAISVMHVVQCHWCVLGGQGGVHV